MSAKKSFMPAGAFERAPLAIDLAQVLESKTESKAMISPMTLDLRSMYADNLTIEAS